MFRLQKAIFSGPKFTRTKHYDADIRYFTAYAQRFFLHGEGPRSTSYGRTTALRLFVQPYDEDEQFFKVLHLVQ
jgi:hypothetical protein